MQTFVSLIQILRLHQWSKNFLVFAAQIFSRNLSNKDHLLSAVFAFLSFSFLSSCIYIINDILDAEKDKLHPQKRFRPIPSGKLKKRTALLWALFILVLAYFIALRVDGGDPFLYCLGCYFIFNIAYSIGVKKLVVADVIVIAFGFLLRVIAGGQAIHVEVSHWLILCTFFGAIMLASCKRRAELASLGSSSQVRAVLTDYTFPLLDVLITISASLAIMAYTLYTVAERTVAAFHTTYLIYTVPVVMYGICRYLFLVYTRDRGEDPAILFLRDRGLLLAIVIWITAACIIVYGAA